MSDGGFGGGRSVSELLEETNFYFTVKSIINQAKSKTDSYKRTHEKRRGR